MSKPEKSADKRGRVVVLGVFVADTTYRADRLPRMGETMLGTSFALGPGGKGSNQAIAAARLGGDVTMLTRLGRDDFADMAIQTWADAGVRPEVLYDSANHTGAAFVFVDDNSGDNAIIIAPGAAATLSSADADSWSSVISEADVFMTQLEQPEEAAMRGLQIARQAGVTTILNPAPAMDLTDEMLALCDYITPNETETHALTGISLTSLDQVEKAARILQERGAGVPVITLGERGAYVPAIGLIPATSVGTVVETTGAGDAFNGGLATALARGAVPKRAVQVGCATAGISVTRAGAAASMPTLAEVQSHLTGDF